MARNSHSGTDRKQRSAGVGPWIAREDCEAFRAWLNARGIQWRPHTGLGSNGYQVQHAGHWMALLWNKAFRRYTADPRLSLLVQSFAAERTAATWSSTSNNEHLNGVSDERPEFV